MKDQKYVVFKREEFAKCMAALLVEVDPTIPADIASRSLNDAVVIRRQDIFAPPALDAYANAILVVVEGLKLTGLVTPGLLSDLTQVADYFHQQAKLAWETNRKLPD